MQGRVASVNSSTDKGERKNPVSEAVLVAGYGMEGDAHAGGERQISLLAGESIEKAVASGVDLKPGDFGENITTLGIDLRLLTVGSRLMIGDDAILQRSHVGKTCESPCSIGQRLGDCIMPREGMFAKVVRGGRVAVGDRVEPTTIKAAAVLTSSDRCAHGETQDKSGPALVDMIGELGFALADYRALPDEQSELSEHMRYLADRCAVDLILTTGGTGFSPRDRIPEATLAVLESPASGIAEAIRYEGLRHTPKACLSRAVSGLRGRTLIVNLPGSLKAVEQSIPLLRSILPHALDILRGEVSDCGASVSS